MVVRGVWRKPWRMLFCVSWRGELYGKPVSPLASLQLVVVPSGGKKRRHSIGHTEVFQCGLSSARLFHRRILRVDEFSRDSRRRPW